MTPERIENLKRPETFPKRINNDCETVHQKLSTSYCPPVPLE